MIQLGPPKCRCNNLTFRLSHIIISVIVIVFVVVFFAFFVIITIIMILIIIIIIIFIYNISTLHYITLHVIPSIALSAHERKILLLWLASSMASKK